MDYEIGWQDYGMRIYRPDVGRFGSVDPITSQYPELTPYQFASNSPISGIDLDGLERIHYLVQFQKDASGESQPVFNYLDVQRTQRTYLSTIIGSVAFDMPLDKEVVIWTKNGDALGTGYRFSNMSEAFKAAKNNFSNIDLSDPSSSTNAETMWKNDFDKTSSSFSNVGLALASLNFGKVNGRMSNTNVRQWYSDQVKRININVAATEENAMRIVQQRNSLKIKARNMMEDRQLAQDLDQTDPIRDYNYYQEKYSAQGLKGEQLYKRIMEGGTTPNQKVNDKLNIK